MLSFSRIAIGTLVLAAVVFSARIEDSDNRRNVISLHAKNGDDILYEADLSVQARDKRTIGLLLGGVADLFGFDVQRRPSVVPTQNGPVAPPAAVQQASTFARQQVPPAAPPPAPAPAAPTPAAPPNGIPPPLTAPVTLTDGVRRAFQVGVDWSNQRQQLGGAPPAAAPPPPAPAPAPAAPAAAPPAAAAPPPPPPVQGERRSLAVGLNWQNLRQQLGGPPPAVAPAAPPPPAPAAPAGPPPPQGVRQSYQLGLDFTNQRQQLGGPPPGPPLAAAAPAPAAAPPPTAAGPARPRLGAPIANLGTLAGRPFPPRLPSLLREKPLSPTLVERIYFNKDKPPQKNIYYQKNEDIKFETSPPLINEISGSGYRTTTTSSIPYALGINEVRPPPHLDTPPNEIEEDDNEDDDNHENNEDSSEGHEDNEDGKKEAPRGFGKVPPAKVYKVDTGDPNDETYVLEEDYTYGDKPKKFKIDFPDYSEDSNEKKRELLKENKKEYNFNRLWKTSPYTPEKIEYNFINPTPLTVIHDLKNEKPIEIKYSDGEFRTSKHHRAVRSVESVDSSPPHQDTSLNPTLTRSYVVHHDSQPAENIVAAKLLNKKILNYYDKKFFNDAVAARHAILNPHLINEPYYELSPEQYQEPYSIYFKGEEIPNETPVQKEIVQEIASPTPELKQEVKKSESLGVVKDDGTVERYHQNALKSLVNTFEGLSRYPGAKKYSTNLDDDREVQRHHHNALKSIVNTFKNKHDYLANTKNIEIDQNEVSEPPINNSESLNAEKDVPEEVIKHQEKVLELIKETDDVIKETDYVAKEIDTDVLAPLLNNFYNKGIKNFEHGDKDVVKHQKKVLELIREADEVINRPQENENTEIKTENVNKEQEPTENNEDDDERVKVGNENVIGANEGLNEHEKDDKEIFLDKEYHQETDKILKENNEDVAQNENSEENEQEGDDKQTFDYEYFVKPFEFVKEIENVIYPESNKKSTESKADINEDFVQTTGGKNVERQNIKKKEEVIRTDAEEQDYDENEETDEAEKNGKEENIVSEPKDVAVKDETEKAENIEEKGENVSDKKEDNPKGSLKEEDEETEDNEDTEDEDAESDEEDDKSDKSDKENQIAKEEEIEKLRTEEEKRRKLEENEKQINEYIKEHFEVDEINGVNVPKAVKDTERYNNIVENTKKTDLDQFSYFPHHEYQFKELDSFFGKEFDENLKQLDQSKNKIDKQMADKEEEVEEEEEDEEAEDEEAEDEEAEDEEAEDEEAENGGEADKESEDEESDKDKEILEKDQQEASEDDEESNDEESEEESEENCKAEEEAESKNAGLQYPHEDKSKEIYNQFHQQLSQAAAANPETQDSNRHEVKQSLLHSGGFKSGKIEVIDTSEKVVTVPYDYDYSGSEKKVIVQTSFSENENTLLKRRKRSVLGFAKGDKASRIVKRDADDADGYTWLYKAEKYDPRFTYNIPEPNIPDLKKLEVKENKDDDKLGPFAIITENESGRKKTYIRVNQKQTESYR